MIVKIFDFDDVLTVKQLKDILSNWPETRSNGSPTEVWINRGDNKSSPLQQIWPLDKGDDGTADILFDV